MINSNKNFNLCSASNKLFETKLTSNSFLTIKELSIWLNVKTKTIYNMVYNKSIPYLKAGTMLRFKKEDIEAWLTR